MNQIDTVMIVDDDPIARTIYHSFMMGLGMADIYQAASGQEAARMLAQVPGKVQLLVLDLNMPEMDGIEMLKHLHEIAYEGHLAIGSAAHRATRESAEKLADLYGLNLIGFISKPLTKRKLDEVLLPAVSKSPVRLAG